MPELPKLQGRVLEQRKSEEPLSMPPQPPQSEQLQVQSAWFANTEHIHV